jgi:hypothetical protein
VTGDGSAGSRAWDLAASGPSAFTTAARDASARSVRHASTPPARVSRALALRHPLCKPAARHPAGYRALLGAACALRPSKAAQPSTLDSQDTRLVAKRRDGPQSRARRGSQHAGRQRRSRWDTGKRPVAHDCLWPVRATERPRLVAGNLPFASTPRRGFRARQAGPVVLRVVGHLPARAARLRSAPASGQVSDKPRGRKPRRTPRWLSKAGVAMAIGAALPG